MSQPRDGWDADERDALDGLEGELAEIRRRHQDDPSLAVLRAAEADALPPEEQARVARHLQESAWSRTVIDGLRDTGVDDRLDEHSVDRLFTRITREARATSAPPARRRTNAGLIVGGLALAATVLVAVVVSRPDQDAAIVPREAPPAATPSAPRPEPVITYTKPDVKLSPSALTWRGAPDANPFLRDLAPAFRAYRAGDYVSAAAEFEQLATVYPDAIEVRFYEGVSLMLGGNHRAAIRPLEAAARLKSGTFADDVTWFLAVARQRAGHAEARDNFAALCRGTSSHAAAACAAVTQLDAAPSSPRQP